MAIITVGSRRAQVQPQSVTNPKIVTVGTQVPGTVLGLSQPTASTPPLAPSTIRDDNGLTGAQQRYLDDEIIHRPKWLAQTAWHIRFDDGDDRADGDTGGAALKTLAELYRRLGRDFAPKQPVDIYLYGDNKPTDPWDTEWACNVPTSLPVVYIYPALPQYPLIQVRVHAMTPTTYYTGAFTAVRREVRNYPTDLPLVVTDTNMKGANQTPPVLPPNDQVYWYNSTLDWFSRPRGNNHDQQRMRITSGPRAGAIAWTSPGNLGVIFGGGTNGDMRCNIFGISVPFAYTAGFQTFGVTAAAVQVADPYTVERLQLLYINRIVSKGNGDNYGSGIAFNGFKFRCPDGGDSQNPSTQPVIKVDGGSLAFIECSFDFVLQVINTGASNAFFWALNCSTIDGIVATGQGFFYVDSGVHHLQLAATNDAFLVVDADALVQTGSIAAYKTGEIWLKSAQVWDLPGHAIKAALIALDGGRIRPFASGSFYGTNRVWGQDETGQRKYGIACQDGAQIEFDPTYTSTMITVSGHTKDINIGHSANHNDQGVGIDPTTLQQTTMRDLTYDNFFNKTIAQGGFGQGTGQVSHIVDPETMSVIHGPTPVT